MSTSQLSSIAPLLPLRIDPSSGTLRWISGVESALTLVAGGPDTSLVSSGIALYDIMVDMRVANGETSDLSPQVAVGLTRLFDQLEIAPNFFKTTLPNIAKLCLQFPGLLRKHVREVNGVCGEKLAPVTLRVLRTQEPGLVLLHQHFIAALLACAFFCLYPSAHKERKKDSLSLINFDALYVGVVYAGSSQVGKVKCLINYFKKVCTNMPQGTVSFERKVLLPKNSSPAGAFVAFPSEDFWSKCQLPLCKMEVLEKGAIEDAGSDYMQVDFANESLGGGVLNQGCVQEEIRFMISPELIAGMLFLAPMADNESIEMIGAQTFSKYEGYAHKFCFAGDYIDDTPRDSWGRRKTYISAIDALCSPGESQFEPELILRELNKAFCGFLNHSSLCDYPRDWEELATYETRNTSVIPASQITESAKQEQVNSTRPDDKTADQELLSANESEQPRLSEDDKADSTGRCVMHETHKGIATGNWGSGAFGGNLELKSLLQWLAASVAGCPKVQYYSFGDHRARRLQEVIDWIVQEGWPVAELWTMLIEYGNCRLNRQVKSELYDWILPQPSTGKYTLRPKALRFALFSLDDDTENLVENVSRDRKLLARPRRLYGGCWFFMFRSSKRE